VLLIKDESRIALDAVVHTLQPMVEPAHRLIAPFGARPVDAGVGAIVIPGPDPGMHRSGDALEHADDAVAVAVLEAADQEAGDRDVFQAPDRSTPEWPVTLVTEVLE